MATNCSTEQPRPFERNTHVPVPLHTTGKASFDDIYHRPDPRDYYTRLADLDYRIPELAKTHFAQQILECRAATGGETLTVLDIGCSYGINAALLRLDTSMGELAEYYGDAVEFDRAALAARDRARLATADKLPGIRFLGMDAARPALAYAHAAGLLHDTVHADLETSEPTEEQRRILASADLVISTGCIGYVTEKTLARIASAGSRRPPWMAHFVLRMFDFAPIAAHLSTLGYRTERVPGMFEQRRFASPGERSQVLDLLTAKGIDTAGYEAQGWLYANLYLSRP
ncbi:class I SAM-dependent methyltransferase [Nocardia goodfellowii]|uniref:SAM-dependent methyltransferase n=1 Tax=Nocardia goodfellowii TaxID=882446 RepID=A0ABS4QGV9_9NOCA|nr:class I SAM-dependent methyltransferase [Nocardia goodfellowii]MBP2190942.1 SAM-dependent methyltransferase [Nocardia goodfellowii]